MALKESILLTFPGKKVYCVGMGVARFKSYGLLDHVEYDKLTNPLLIVVDVPNRKRVDGIDGLKYKELIKIDHHPAEDIVGNVDYTDTEASSASQMVCELILNTKLALNEKIASNLFLGIVSDSERFVHKNTTVETFQIVHDLIIASGIDFTELYQELYLRPISEIKFQAYLTNNINITDNKLGYLHIPLDVFKDYNVDVATASNIINNFNFIKEMIVWLFVTYDEKSNQYKVSIRSRGPVINEVASRHNGGGHKFACGCRLNSLSEMDELVHDLDALCKKYNEEL
ncbi:MAG: hypothetical protein IJO33_02575 [Bacilli bacterium]|nr:hypothetical protein [Bacilli bacterium]